MLNSKQSSLRDLIARGLNEQEDESSAEKEASPEPDSQDSEITQKDKDRKNKDLNDIDKDDLEYDDEFEDEDVAASFKLNDNTKKGGGQIKMVTFKRLSTISSIEDILKVFDIQPDNIEGVFENQLEITIGSPLNDFKDEQYVVRLMDGAGELSIYRKNFDHTITKQGTGTPTNMASAAQQGLGDEGEETQQTEKPIDLSYLTALNYEFQQAVKNEYFSRILAKGE